MQSLEVIPVECLRHLYAGVMVTALKDALKWMKSGGKSGKHAIQNKVWGEQAWNWIFDDSLIFNGFRSICDLLNINCAKIRMDIEKGHYCVPENECEHWLRRYRFGHRQGVAA